MSATLTAACLHMAHALALGLMMSVGYRVKVLWLPRDDFKAMIDSKSFKIASAVQLNVNEWTPYFVAALLYLHTQGAGSNLVAWGSVLSSLGFSASKLVVFHGKPAPVASTTRYLALAALIPQSTEPLIDEPTLRQKMETMGLGSNAQLAMVATPRATRKACPPISPSPFLRMYSSVSSFRSPFFEAACHSSRPPYH